MNWVSTVAPVCNQVLQISIWLDKTWPWSLDVHRPFSGQDTTESMRDTFYQYCGNQRKVKAPPNTESSPVTRDPKAFEDFKVTSATKCNHLLWDGIIIRTTGHSVSFPALPAPMALPYYSWQHASPLAMMVVCMPCMPPGNQKCVTSSLAPRQISTGH